MAFRTAGSAVATLLLLSSGCSTPQSVVAAGTPSPHSGANAQACAALSASNLTWPDTTMKIVSAKAVDAGATVPMGFAGLSPPLPAHCEVTGILRQRVGDDGQDYAIRFKMRLPFDWNRRFLFQGGGGTNGEIGEALGLISPGQPPALMQGYAVITQDSGHSNQLNADPAKGGVVSFGMDAQARADYGHASLKLSYDAARAIIARFYGSDPAHSYFVGCSKGGQEGMAFAQRYPDSFDGIVAGAPGFSLPKAAVAEAWDTQAFASALSLPAGKTPSLEDMAASFSDSDLMIARQAILDACDADDGLVDGIVGAFGQCTTTKVMMRLRAKQCVGGKTNACLSGAQIDALERSHAGPRNRNGEALYASFPWDAGLADNGWRVWKIGLAAKDGRPGVPAINATMGARSLAAVFSTPPHILGQGPQEGLDYQLGYDFDRDAPMIFATNARFPRSAWTDISARSEDLSGFRRHGAKMIVPQGVSDPVFSINDTIAWWNGVNRLNGGAAASFVRVFPVPGMAHCGGGPSTDQFNALDALVQWVEQGKAPDRILASAGPSSPWPGRKRPLCPYPLIARPTGHGDPEDPDNFVCAQ